MKTEHAMMAYGWRLADWAMDEADDGKLDFATELMREANDVRSTAYENAFRFSVIRPAEPQESPHG